MYWRGGITLFTLRVPFQQTKDSLKKLWQIRVKNMKAEEGSKRIFQKIRKPKHYIKGASFGNRDHAL